MGEGAPLLARRDNVLRQVAALEVNINRSRNRNAVKAREKEMGPKKGKDGGGKGDKGKVGLILYGDCFSHNCISVIQKLMIVITVFISI